MSILSLFKKKNKYYNITDEDRQKSIEIRKIKKEQNNLLFDMEILKKKADIQKVQLEINKIKAEIFDEEEEYEELEQKDNSSELMLMSLITNLFQKGNTNAQPQQIESPPKVSVSLPDSELKTVLKSIPKLQQKILKAMSDENLNALLIDKFPIYDDDTRSRAIKLLKAS